MILVQFGGDYYASVMLPAVPRADDIVKFEPGRSFQVLGIAWNLADPRNPSVVVMLKERPRS